MKFVAGLLVASTCCLKGHEPFETSSMVLAIRGQSGCGKQVCDHHERGRVGFTGEKGPAA
ncbi:MAG: hypothetical protein WA231_11550 [Methylocella sp.]